MPLTIPRLFRYALSRPNSLNLSKISKALENKICRFPWKPLLSTPTMSSSCFRQVLFLFGAARVALAMSVKWPRKFLLMGKLIRRLWLKVVRNICYFSIWYCYKCSLFYTFKGQEKADFWTLLGGKGSYITDMRTAEEIQEHEPRLFQCSNATGNIKVKHFHNILAPCTISIFCYCNRLKKS